MGEFFDAKYLMDMLDANGKKPEIFIVCSRVRGPGKTTGITKKLLERALKTGEKFVIVCRKKGHIGNYAPGMLKGSADMVGGYQVEEKVGIQGLYSNVYLTKTTYDEEGLEEEDKEKIHVAYVVSLRGAYDIKQISSLFVDTWCSVQDEFIAQSESEYITSPSDEPTLLMNLHTSLARGGGKSVRYYPHFMMANCIDVLNPYFIALGLVGKLQPNTRKYRGDGVVYMRYESDVIAKEHADSPFNRAFKSHSNENDFQDNSWLVTSSSLTGKPPAEWGTPYYKFNLHNGKNFMRVAIYEKSFVYMLDYGREKGLRTFAVQEPEPGEIMWDAPGVTIRKLMREWFKKGQLRFRKEQVKREYMEII